MKNAVLAEFLGTGFLLVSVVGSGIMAETLAGGNIALDHPIWCGLWRAFQPHCLPGLCAARRDANHAGLRLHISADFWRNNGSDLDPCNV